MSGVSTRYVLWRVLVSSGIADSVSCQWILPTLQADRPHQDFPEPDLLADLTDLFFENINNYYPLMHRPTFDQDIQNGLHFRDEGFGSVVLLMCAVASRFSDDPRVFLADSDSSHSCGWKYFTQVQMVRRSLLAAPRLYDLQLCFVSIARELPYELRNSFGFHS